jgi:hypothetical protein
MQLVVIITHRIDIIVVHGGGRWREKKGKHGVYNRSVDTYTTSLPPPPYHQPASHPSFLSSWFWAMIQM